MTANDLKLIYDAEHRHCHDEDWCAWAATKADTEEARRRLREQATFARHWQEGLDDML